MKTISALFTLLALGACAHQPPKVACDRNLTPINPPTPIVKAAAAPSASSAP
jgi:hypothetical protein